MAVSVPVLSASADIKHESTPAYAVYLQSRRPRTRLGTTLLHGGRNIQEPTRRPCAVVGQSRDRPRSIEESLGQLDPVTRARLREGDWWIPDAGAMFNREWFELVDEAPSDCLWVRFWDLAATKPHGNNDPDWTAGALVGLKSGVWYVKDMQRVRTPPQGVEALVVQTAEMDGRTVSVRMEQEPGASGVAIIDHYARRVLVGWDFQGIRATGDKTGRAAPVSSAAEAGNVKLVRGRWIGDFLDEFDAFPRSEHDDQVDAVSGAVNELSRVGMPKVRWVS